MAENKTRHCERSAAISNKGDCRGRKLPRNDDSIRTFGRTSSRMGAGAQEKLEKRLQAFAFTKADLNWAGETELEVGMGNGLAMLERAKANPSKLFVGIEVYKNGLRSLVNGLEKAGSSVTNVRIVANDAREFMAQLPANSINSLVVLYPDPWPKKKHHKRRLIQGEFLDLAMNILPEDGTFFVATDIPDYVFWILHQVYDHGGFAPAATCPSHWATAPAWWVTTKYEAKAGREGRFAWYLGFLKKT